MSLVGRIYRAQKDNKCNFYNKEAVERSYDAINEAVTTSDSIFNRKGSIWKRLFGAAIENAINLFGAEKVKDEYVPKLKELKTAIARYNECMNAENWEKVNRCINFFADEHKNKWKTSNEFEKKLLSAVDMSEENIAGIKNAAKNTTDYWKQQQASATAPSEKNDASETLSENGEYVLKYIAITVKVPSNLTEAVNKNRTKFRFFCEQNKLENPHSIKILEYWFKQYLWDCKEKGSCDMKKSYENFFKLNAFNNNTDLDKDFPGLRDLCGKKDFFDKLDNQLNVWLTTKLLKYDIGGSNEESDNSEEISGKSGTQGGVRFGKGSENSEKRKEYNNKVKKLQKAFEKFDELADICLLVGAPQEGKDAKSAITSVAEVFRNCFKQPCLTDNKNKTFSATDSWYEKDLNICEELDEYNGKLNKNKNTSDSTVKPDATQIKLWKKLFDPGMRAKLSITGRAAINNKTVREDMKNISKKFDNYL